MSILKFENVTGKQRKFNLKNISLELEPGYIYTIMGLNGAGKSTLMNYVMLENMKYDGSITVDGLDIKKRRAEALQRIGFVCEDRLFLEADTALTNAEILGHVYEAFSLDKFNETAEKLGVPVGRKLMEMSRGESLKFQLAFAAAYSPRLYLIDEMTVGMDPVFRKELFDFLRRLICDEEAGILMNSHIMSDVEKQADYVAVMKDGELSEFSEAYEVRNMKNNFQTK